MLWDSIFEEFAEAAHDARDVFIVSPFIKEGVVSRLLTAGIESLIVVTRWRLEEIVGGISDLGVYRVVKRFGGELRLLDSLHAKFYRFDEFKYLGSANLTNRGLGIHHDSNLELVSRVLEPTRAFEQMILDRSSAVTDSLYAQYREFERLLSQQKSKPSNYSLDEAPPAHHDWLPTLRRPELLYEVYCEETDDITRSSFAMAQMDLQVLHLPSGLDAESFRLFVASRLSSMPFFQQLDQFVEENSRRFGEMAAFVRDKRGLNSMSDAKVSWQTILRWLVYFHAHRYTMSTNPYSEIISIKE